MVTHPLKVLAITLCAILALCCAGCSALRKPADEISTRLLASTPVGTPQAEVESQIARQGWKRLSGKTLASEKAAPQPAESFVTNEIGNYASWEHLFPLRIHVFVTWIFSADGRLNRVHIYKETTGP